MKPFRVRHSDQDLSRMKPLTLRVEFAQGSHAPRRVNERHRAAGRRRIDEAAGGQAAAIVDFLESAPIEHDAQ